MKKTLTTLSLSLLVISHMGMAETIDPNFLGRIIENTSSNSGGAMQTAGAAIALGGVEKITKANNSPEVLGLDNASMKTIYNTICKASSCVNTCKTKLTSYAAIDWKDKPLPSKKQLNLFKCDNFTNPSAHNHKFYNAALQFCAAALPTPKNGLTTKQYCCIMPTDYLNTMICSKDKNTSLSTLRKTTYNYTGLCGLCASFKDHLEKAGLLDTKQ